MSEDTSEPAPQSDPLEGLTEDELYQLVCEEPPEHKVVVRRFAEHPVASPRVWHELLASGGPFVELVISEIEGALASESVRHRLSESRLPQVLSNLAAAAEGDELRRLVGRLQALNPDSALQFLEDHADRARQLAPDDLVGLLQSRDPEERERALRLLGPPLDEGAAGAS